MATYNLNIQIDQSILAKRPSDNLNIARRVNDVFTASFAGGSIQPIGNQDQLLQNNRFQWQDRYGVFLSMQYKHGVVISAATATQAIEFGQKTTFNPNNMSLSDPVNAPISDFDDGTSVNSFLVDRIPDYLRISVVCKGANDRWLPIYVDNRAHTGLINKTLTPSNTYSLYWDEKVTSGSTIDYSRSSNQFEFQFEPGQTERTLRWGYAKPDSPSGITEQPSWYVVE